ncbi:SIMPL domain-containing protein [Pusillimonas sp. DMV24BSW_D]|uniref:SIMPL domain-containing protein n=1 Tax=Neopusillimonas aestuarii TaxID=2716226 RepID=UPI00140BBA18|nr:SIMPL domain-containing protein [Pusillimonas sp. DMV24BSW_D]QIM47986.1 SIMPL domain-containing protein [Pusillimonas sp. DMV24BSW_D]
MRASTILLALVILVAVAAGTAAGGWSVGKGLERFRMADRTVVVKGLAEAQVKSDYASWLLTFRRADNDFGAVQRALSADREKVVAFLKDQGFTNEEVEVRPLQVQDVYSREYAASDQPFRYTGTGQVLVKTPRVDLVSAAALGVDPLIQEGLVIEGGMGPQYQLRGFNDHKSPLLEEATNNAREQAEKFASDAGASLGPLKYANQGVIQIFGEGVDYDDPSSQVKRLRVVSTFEYQLR